MTQVPASSHGGFTLPAVASTTDAVSDPLTLTSPEGTLTWSHLGELDLHGLNFSHATVYCDEAGATTSGLMDSKGSFQSSGGAFTVYPAGGGNQIVALDSVAGIIIALHAAPADGAIQPGECALWFDQTNGAGATKLMVKGKSADGTVKTATILLA